MTTNHNKTRWPYEAQIPEAAHAAIDWDDDKRAAPGAGPAVWLVLGVALVLACWAVAVAIAVAL